MSFSSGAFLRESIRVRSQWKRVGKDTYGSSYVSVPSGSIARSRRLPEVASRVCESTDTCKPSSGSALMVQMGDY